MKKVLIILAVIALGLTTIYMIGCGSGGVKKPPSEDPITPIPIPPSEEIPAPPRNVTAQAGNRLAIISWERVYSAVGYRIYKSEDGVTFVRLTGTANISGTQAVVGQLQNGKSYYFGVTALDERNNESGMGYPGGAPTAVRVIPFDPYVPPTIPSPPYDVDYVPGDRKVMILWDHDEPEALDKFTIRRKMNIDPLANVPDAAQRIPEYERLFDAVIELPTTFNDLEVGDFINGFTVPAIPYHIDKGIRMVGLPPNYLPLGLVDGDVDYEYTVGAWIGTYSAMARTIKRVVPLDLPPSAPVLLGATLVPVEGTELGIGIRLEWTQPRPPENSDIRNYLLKRTQMDTGLDIFVEIKQPYDQTITSVSYIDRALVPGKTYIYEVFAQDYYAQVGAGSNKASISTPAPPDPDPDPEPEG